ncbi:hypothetical protein Vretifemale_16441 [Volvox reticuliferus]|uniref:Transcription factor Tfb2 C-terminal domain-containing protein n=1 Tax=Volvox reticuliferus TaxID=1737510 RepID=A0A8J4CTJ9_9CHLO|nr:hypothetical protein Vretifemale_16441 [Volvox reticuliferus]
MARDERDVARDERMRVYIGVCVCVCLCMRVCVCVCVWLCCMCVYGNGCSNKEHHMIFRHSLGPRNLTPKLTSSTPQPHPTSCICRTARSHFRFHPQTPNPSPFPPSPVTLTSLKIMTPSIKEKTQFPISPTSPRPSPVLGGNNVSQVVSDQIRLWEASMNRLRADAAVLYEKMENRELFERAVAFARSSGTLLWEDSAKMKFVALDAGHEAMKGFIVRAKQEIRQ